MADESRTEGQTPQQQAQQAANQIPTDYSQLSTIYSNFCRISLTHEEVVLDFGLNTQMTPTVTEPIKLTHRVVMNFYTAKRLLNVLLNVVNQYENVYGALEIDPQKRVRSFPRQAGGTPPTIKPGPG
jgi:hypothetical protein